MRGDTNITSVLIGGVQIIDINVTNVVVQVCNKMVTVLFNGASATSNVIGSMPEQYRPINDVWAFGRCTLSSTSKYSNAFLAVRTTGQIRCNPWTAGESSGSTANSTDIWGSLTYPIK